jgi:large subunit ribosomal protein L15
MKTHKRRKNSRIRGARTVGWGFRQKHKGHGNKGGFGMAGTGKRADHKKQSALESDTKKKKRYFGKQGVTSRGTALTKYEKINLYAIKDNLFTKEGCKIDLSKHKILGTGDGFKAEITALAATASAIKKMEAAGGKIILPKVVENKKQYVVKEKVEKKETSDDEE